MAKAKKIKTFIKIIYFDEGSATDLLYILDGGKSTDKEEKIVTKTTQLAAGAEAQAGTKINLLTKITTGMGIDGSADASREGQSILSKAIENTVLTDYIRCAENEAKSHITVFTKCKPYAFPGSFTYFKMLTPYLTMTDGKVEVAQGLNFNLALMDQALSSGRGYYELIVQQPSEKVVLRFNINAFRNNYSISDIVKMELDYHAIYVGTISEDSLEMQSEFSEKKKEISGYDIVKSDTTASAVTSLKVYDVILAGICV